jgi:hypothetical protein
VSYFKKIDREFMVRFNLFRRALLDFEAFRAMWARKATATPFCSKGGVDMSDLEDGQSKAIVELLSAAENIRKHVGLKWMTVMSDEDGEFADGIYLGESDDEPITAIEIINDECFMGGRNFGSPGDLINQGWKLDGPIRSSVLR